MHRSGYSSLPGGTNPFPTSPPRVWVMDWCCGRRRGPRAPYLHPAWAPDLKSEIWRKYPYARRTAVLVAPQQPGNLLQVFNKQLIVAFIIHARPPPPCSLLPPCFCFRFLTSCGRMSSPPSPNSPPPLPGCPNILLSLSPPYNLVNMRNLRSCSIAAASS